MLLTLAPVEPLLLVGFYHSLIIGKLPAFFSGSYLSQVFSVYSTFG
jgi:hypothetical protein